LTEIRLNTTLILNPGLAVFVGEEKELAACNSFILTPNRKYIRKLPLSALLSFPFSATELLNHGLRERAKARTEMS